MLSLVLLTNFIEAKPPQNKRERIYTVSTLLRSSNRILQFFVCLPLYVTMLYGKMSPFVCNYEDDILDMLRKLKIKSKLETSGYQISRSIRFAGRFSMKSVT